MFPNLVVNLLLNLSNLTSDNVIGQLQSPSNDPNATIAHRNEWNTGGYQHKPSSNITIINRIEWGANNVLSHPVPYVIIHHTGRSDPACTTKTKCMESIRGLRQWNMASRYMQYPRGEAMYDIAYNFVVAGDGNVYEGTGWFASGSHTREYNRKSIGIAFLGDWNSTSPPDYLLELAKQLIKVGVDKGYVSKNYKLKGHTSSGTRTSEQGDEDVQCPGLALNENLQTWEHYDGIV